jgi:acyl-CoA hydrolase
MEQCAYISASRLRAQHVLTAAMDVVVFKAPTRVGDVMYITAQVGGTSSWAEAGRGAQPAPCHPAPRRCRPASRLRLTPAGGQGLTWPPLLLLADSALPSLTPPLPSPPRPPPPPWQVSAVFGSSLEVMVSVFGETPSEGEVFHCADALATVVLVGQDGEPRRCAFQLRPGSEAEQRRWVSGWLLVRGPGAEGCRRWLLALALRPAAGAVPSGELSGDQ